MAILEHQQITAAFYQDIFRKFVEVKNALEDKGNTS